MTIGFTSLDRNLVIDGVTYYANTAIDPTAISQDTDGGSNDLEIKGLIKSDLLRDVDIRSGLYNGKEIEVFVADFANLTNVRTLVKGTWGEVKKTNLTWAVTVKTNADRLNNTVSQKIQGSCRWTGRLRSPRCGVNIEDHAISATITGGISGKVFNTNQTFSAPDSTRIFNVTSGGGYIVVQTGNNAGFTLRIDNVNQSGVVTLLDYPPYAFQVDDIVVLYPGCDGTSYTCDRFYNNLDHWGGFPTDGNFFPTKEDLRR